MLSRLFPLLFLFSISFSIISCQQDNSISLFPPDMWHHHLHNPYYVYYNGNNHNGGQVIDHRNDRVRSSHGHLHKCEGWTCHSDFE